MIIQLTVGELSILIGVCVVLGMLLGRRGI